MSSNIARVKHNEILGSQANILSLEETEAYFSWIEKSFPMRYGHIDSEQVPHAQLYSIDGLTNPEIAALFERSQMPLEREWVFVWATSPQGIQVSLRLALEHFDSVWRPVSDDLWIISLDRKHCVEVHHESTLNFIHQK